MKKKLTRPVSYGFGKILEENIKKKFKNQMDFANAIGVTQATVSRYINETASPSFHILHKISEILEIDMPFNSNLGAPTNAIKIPMYYSEVSAGKGATSLDSNFEYVMFDEQWLKNQFLIKDTKGMFAVKVQGDSMSPIIQEGDIVFARTVNEYQPSQGTYIVRHNGDYLIKKIQFKSTNMVKLISNNPEYDPIEIDTNKEGLDFSILAKVIGRMNVKSLSYSV